MTFKNQNNYMSNIKYIQLNHSIRNTSQHISYESNRGLMWRVRQKLWCFKQKLWCFLTAITVTRHANLSCDVQAKNVMFQAKPSICQALFVFFYDVMMTFSLRQLSYVQCPTLRAYIGYNCRLISRTFSQLYKKKN